MRLCGVRQLSGSHPEQMPTAHFLGCVTHSLHVQSNVHLQFIHSSSDLQHTRGIRNTKFRSVKGNILCYADLAEAMKSSEWGTTEPTEFLREVLNNETSYTLNSAVSGKRHKYLDERSSA